jgi:hypothetical protein
MIFACLLLLFSIQSEGETTIELHFKSTGGVYLDPDELRIRAAGTMELLAPLKRKATGIYSFSDEVTFQNLCVEASSTGLLPYFEVFRLQNSHDQPTKIPIEFQPARSLCLEMPSGLSGTLDLHWAKKGVEEALDWASLETPVFSKAPWQAFALELAYSAQSDSFLTTQVILTEKPLEAKVRWGSPPNQYSLPTTPFGSAPLPIYQLPREVELERSAQIEFHLTGSGKSISSSPQAHVIQLYCKRWENGKSILQTSLFAIQSPNTHGVYQAHLPPGIYSFLAVPRKKWNGSGVAYLPNFEETETIDLSPDPDRANPLSVTLETPAWLRYTQVPEEWDIPSIYGAVYLLFDSHGYPIMPKSSLLGPLEGYLDNRETYRLEIRTRSQRLAASYSDLQLSKKLSR